MAWGKEEKPPEPPVDKKPDFNVEEFFTKLDATLSPIKTGVENALTRLSAIEERTQPKPRTEDSPIPSVLEDEDAAFKKRVNEPLTSLAMGQVQLRAQMIEREIFDEMRSNGWDEYIPEVRKYLQEVNIQTKAEPNYEVSARNVMDMVIGKAARSSGLKRRNSSFILEDANATPNDPARQQLQNEDAEFLNFEVVTSKGKRVTRRELLERQGVLVEENGQLVEKHDLSDPAVLAAAKKSWAKVQVVN